MWPDPAQCSTACKHLSALLTYSGHSPCLPNNPSEPHLSDHANLWLLRREAPPPPPAWKCTLFRIMWCPGQLIPCSNCLWAGESEVQTPVGERFLIPTQTAPEAHPVSCTMGVGGGGLDSQGMVVTTHAHLERWLKKRWSYISMPLLCLHDMLQGELYIFTGHCATNAATFSWCLNSHWTAQPSPDMLSQVLHMLYKRHEHYFSIKR
jgi:hypothetical protein